MGGGPCTFTDLTGVVELPKGRVLGYAEWGDPDGLPVLWFHGTPGACMQVPPIAPVAAKERGIRLVGVERPGTGRSTPHRYRNMISWAMDVEHFVAARSIERFAAVGLSGGGPYVLATAHHLPDQVVAGAVLGGIGPIRGDEAAPGYTKLLAPFEPLLSLITVPAGEALSFVLRPLASVAHPAFTAYTYVAPACDRPVLRDPQMREAFLHDLVTAIPHGVRAPVQDLLLFARHWGFSLRDVRVPIRFWHGDADVIVPLSHAVHQASLVPDAELTVVPGGGHFSGYTTVEEVFDTLLDLWPAPALR